MAKSKVQTFGHELPWPPNLDGHSVKPPKAKPKGQTQRSTPLYSLLKITPPIQWPRFCHWLIFLMNKTNSLLTIVWVLIPIRPKLPLRVDHLLQKVIILNCDGLWTLAIVWRVERPNSWFLAVWLVEIDGLLTSGHSVKRPLTYATSIWKQHPHVDYRSKYTCKIVVNPTSRTGICGTRVFSLVRVHSSSWMRWITLDTGCKHSTVP
jgi:hypothetical protein